MFHSGGEKHLSVGSDTREWKIGLAMKMATLGFFMFEGWQYDDLALQRSCDFLQTNFQFYSSLVVGAKFLSPFGNFTPKRIIGWDF